METIFITGEQGVGKTAILRALSDKFGDKIRCFDELTGHTFNTLFGDYDRVNIVATQKRLAYTSPIEVTAENRDRVLNTLIKRVGQMCGFFRTTTVDFELLLSTLDFGKIVEKRANFNKFLSAMSEDVYFAIEAHKQLKSIIAGKINDRLQSRDVGGYEKD